MMDGRTPGLEPPARNVGKQDVMSALRTVAWLVGLQFAISAGALALSLHERHVERVDCGKPALVATVTGYNLWKLHECAPGANSVYLMTPPVVGGVPERSAARDPAI